MDSNRVKYKPEGMKTVNPYLMVNDVSHLIEFIEEVFNGKLKYKLDRPNGTIMHAEMIIGDSVIMAGEPMKNHKSFPASIYLYVTDCDAVYKKALQNNAKSIMPPIDMKHVGERYGGVQDSLGNIWWIATHIEELTPEEQAKRIQEIKNNWNNK